MTGPGRLVLLGPGQGRAHRIGADRFVTKGTPRQRSPGFAVIVYEGAPHTPGPPMHVHRSFEETFFLLEGRVAFRAEGRRRTVGSGGYVHVPRGLAHTFQVVGDVPARWIGIISPGRFVALLEELGALIPSGGPPDMARVARLFARYDTEIVPSRT